MPVSSDRILFLDDHLLAVVKLSGELVVRGKGDVQRLPLLDFLKKDYPGLRTVHRLDFETEGVVVFARTKQAYEQILSSRFLGWVKTYRMIVVGRLKRRSGVIDRPLPSRRSSKFQNLGHDSVEAVTRYAVLEEFGHVSYIEAVIETGRHHQIRRHFAAIGHPLVLDRMYGDPMFNQRFSRAFGYRKFFLHAARLELPHPITGKQLIIEAPIPRAFEEVLSALRAQ